MFRVNQQHAHAQAQVIRTFDQQSAKTTQSGVREDLESESEWIWAYKCRMNQSKGGTAMRPRQGGRYFPRPHEEPLALAT